MHLLPLSVAKVSACADKKDSTRFALSGVHLTLEGNQFTAVATDSKKLLMVSGTCAKAGDYPAHPMIDPVKEDKDKKSFLVPGEAWDRAFAMGKVAKKGARSKPILGNLAVKFSKENKTPTATFAATNFESYPVESTREIEGRYPPFNDILNQTTKGAQFLFAADPKMLGDLLHTIASMMGDDDKRVEFFQPPNDKGVEKPFLIVAKGENGEKIDGLMMPLAGPPTRKPTVKYKALTPKSDTVSPSEHTAAPKLDEDQRREPDADPHACVKCHEIDCVCEPVAEETDLDDEPTEVDPTTVKSIPIVFECLTA